MHRRCSKKNIARIKKERERVKDEISEGEMRVYVCKSKEEYGNEKSTRPQ